MAKLAHLRQLASTQISHTHTHRKRQRSELVCVVTVMQRDLLQWQGLVGGDGGGGSSGGEIGGAHSENGLLAFSTSHL